MLRNFQQENLVGMNQFGHYQQTPAEDQMSQISYNLSEQSTTEMQNRFTQLQIEATTTKEKGEIRVESKDHMWKPAPLVNREFIQRELQENKASYSSQINESKPFVLPSYINNQQDYLQQKPAIPDYSEQVQNSSSLPQFIAPSANSAPMGRTVFATPSIAG